MDATQSRAALAARYTTILLDAARRSDVDSAALFGDEPVFATRGRSASWSHDDLGVVSHNLRLATHDELWGMAPGKHIPLGTFRYACEQFALSGSLGEALARAFRLYDLMDSVRFQLHVTGEEASITVSLPSTAQPDADFLHEWWLWLWHYVAQWFVRSEISLFKVDFPHRPAVNPDVYDGTFGSRCSFKADAARIVFSREELSRPVTRTLDEVEDFFGRSYVSLKYSPDVERRVGISVKVALLRRLQREKSMPTLEELAGEQGVTSQTLRRWLLAEGHTYRALKAEVRSLVARHHLGRPDMTLSEVATQAGFAETSGFTRAFRTWTGMNVSQFRQSTALHRSGLG